ncbi:MAG TPA: spermidine/putrescine ABC transporter substrate-binding protein [Solirubrobacterales bacterium]|nr:spermidine/putrescine ABC transporter substrate-binding protein [Solirubrobacterales bacterium]
MGKEQRYIHRDPAWIRGMTQPRLSRRQVMKGAAGAAMSVSLAQLIAACGLPGSRDTGWTAGTDWNAWWRDQQKNGSFNFASWPLYIDTDGGKHPSLDKFTKETGIDVTYSPVIQDNASFFSQISPVLQNGQSIGYDLIVISNGWQLTQLMQNKWLVPLDHSRMPNFRKYAGTVATDLAYDPHLTYCAVWQAGVTAIAYDEKQVDGPIDSLDALFDPKYKGKVGMLSDPDELGTAGLLALGINPQTSTYADWQKSADLLTRQRDDGIVRQYYDNSYIKALEDGDLAISQAYSGDVFQAQNSGYPNLKFVIPKQGGVIWRDNMVIPYHAENPVDAIEWINFAYNPEIAALIADWVNYICPVPAAKPIIANQLDDPTVANSPLVFPSEAELSRLKEYPVTETLKTHEQWVGLFDPIIQS